LSLHPNLSRNRPNLKTKLPKSQLKKLLRSLLKKLQENLPKSQMKQLQKSQMKQLQKSLLLTNQQTRLRLKLLLSELAQDTEAAFA